jgi:hypothetical protein
MSEIPLSLKKKTGRLYFSRELLEGEISLSLKK